MWLIADSLHTCHNTHLQQICQYISLLVLLWGHKVIPVLWMRINLLCTRLATPSFFSSGKKSCLFDTASQISVFRSEFKPWLDLLEQAVGICLHHFLVTCFPKPSVQSIEKLLDSSELVDLIARCLLLNLLMSQHAKKIYLSLFPLKVVVKNNFKKSFS